MTQFEFVSVAISLIFALAVADVLRALIPAARAAVRFWPHFAWLIAMLLNIAYAWWIIWNVRGASWTALLFVYALIGPALLTIMARLLTHRDPYSVRSFREHFHQNRRPFFVVLLAYCVSGFFSGWILGTFPVGTMGPVQVASILGSALALVGLLLRTDRAHGILVVCALLILVFALAVLPLAPLPEPAA